MGSDTTLLAFDTSAAHCAAALLSEGGIVAQRFAQATRGQSERLFPMIDDVLAEAGMTLRALDAIAVGTGPGNFTGIRISVAAARGLSMALGIPAVGVSAFEAARGPGSARDMVPQRVGLGPSKGDQVTVQDFTDGAPHGAPYLLDRADAPTPHDDAPRDLAATIAQIAADKLRQGRPLPRPAPLYIRPADAAPPRDTPPVIVA